MAEWFGNPADWDVWAYVFWGFVLMVTMLVAGYFIGVLWQRWRDRPKD